MLQTLGVFNRPKKLRSGLTNNAYKLVGVDMRTKDGRRFRDIVDGLFVEFGRDADPVRLRELAGLKFSLEATQAAVVAGDQRACEDLVRLSNLVARRERELRTRQRTASARAPLRERAMAAL